MLVAAKTVEPHGRGHELMTAERGYSVAEAGVRAGNAVPRSLLRPWTEGSLFNPGV